MLSIRTNLASLEAQRNLSQSQSVAQSAMSHLSSGMRITKAGDDAAGLAISTRLQAQIKSANQAGRNGNDGLSAVQTAEQGLNTTTNMLTRMRELAVQASSDGADFTSISKEVVQLHDEIDRNYASGQPAGTMTFQVGITGAAASQITATFTDMGTTGLGLSATTGFATAAAARTALATIDIAIDKVSGERATLGAVGNRLQSAVENIQAFSESLSAANSRIRDVDVAEESANLARATVLQQAGISVLAQANQQPQMALKLLG